MNKIKVLLVMIFTFVSLIANADHNDQDFSCQDEVIEINYYGGNFASCSAYNYSTNRYEQLSQYVPFVRVPQYRLYNSQGTASCLVYLPFAYTDTVTQQVCTHTPREPYVSFKRYEFSACNAGIRNGLIDWEPIAGSSYQFEELEGSTWISRYVGSDPFAVFAKQAVVSDVGVSLRVRAINSSSTGSWYNFSIRVPACGTPGDSGVQPF